ncbi:hydroxyacylglutathione hydrolase [Nitrosomonas nitrosa]|uniref:hydroxyacylglutathione hydrolase n=1 Tax=Nitrosomonas nitrosa TaxID=52442 RepID=UPI0023F90337|nr:hydroxyacylglutathione hydrolase [Nitrosomonas nitrosa]MCO6433843.1 hydroxyacylglutathione hydrolase [Nitrosomonas nitrosa]
MPIIYPVRAFKDNYIWVIRDQHYAAIVDPGDAVPVMAYLQQQNLQPIAILNTHHHHDHTGGNIALLTAFALPVYGPAKESIPGLTHRLSEGDTIHLAELSLDLSILDIPGHTAGHIAYYGANLLFCGDTLFACGCGRIFEGTPQQMYTSLQKLTKLPDDTLIYCAHEYTLANIRFATAIDPNNPVLAERAGKAEAQRKRDLPTLPSTLALEKATNPFLRSNQPALIDAANQHAGRVLSDPVSVFTEIRRWKDLF